jgi:TadE-like protein
VLSRLRQAIQTRRDDGAAAVEFALLFIPFSMLVFGLLSGGILFYNYISLTQGGRDAARFGSTYPITDATAWRDKTMSVALSESNFPSTGTLPDSGYACVSFIGVSGSPVYTKAVGTPPSGSYPAAGYSSTRCLSAASDPRTDVRVQVVINRRASIFIGISDLTLGTGTRSVIPYERQYP